jgi:hypothetical protein
MLNESRMIALVVIVGRFGCPQHGDRRQDDEQDYIKSEF